MNVRKAAYITCLVAMISLVFCAVHISKNVIETTPYGVLVSDPGMIFTEYSMKEEAVGEDLTAYSVVNRTIKANGNVVEVNAVLTDGNYADVMNSDMVSGNWFSISSLERENNTVVIDSDLSTQLYLSIDVVGQEIEIDGIIYRISGVCESPDGFLHNISSGVKPNIYMPYTADKTQAVQYMFLENETGNEYREQDVGLLLRDRLQLNIRENSMNSISDKVSLVRAYPFVFVRILISVVLVLLVFLMADMLSKMPYKKEFRAKKTYLFLSVSLVSFAVLVFLLCTLPRIPDSILPEYSVLDMGHYVSWFVGETRAVNSVAGNDINRYILNAIFTLTLIYVLATILIVALLLPVWSRLRRFVLTAKIQEKETTGQE